MPEQKVMTRVQVLKELFQKKGQTIVSFAEELKALSEEDKAELATLGAQELGVTLKV